MKYIDIHAHLDHKLLDGIREETIQSMEQEQIGCLVNTLNFENYQYALQFARKDFIYICPGLYPQEAEKLSEQEFEEYLQWLCDHQNEYVALGEMGLDYYHTIDETKKELQRKRLWKLLQLAERFDKTIILHTRRAEADVLDMIEELIETTQFTKIVLHCFSGKKSLMKRACSLGIYCSLPLIIQNTQSFQILCDLFPLEQLLVETDTPYLHPKKELNTPLTIPAIYQCIAERKGVSEEYVKKIIHNNIEKLFAIRT